MKRAKWVLILVSVVVSALTPTGVGAARSRNVFVSDCIAQETLIPISRQQAQSYLPEGFTPGVGAAGQEHVVYIEFLSTVCGSASKPEIETVIAFVNVRPPKQYAVGNMTESFVLNAVGWGPSIAKLEKQMCSNGVFEPGDISTTQNIDEDDGGISRGSTRVVAPSLSAESSIVATGTGIAGGGGRRFIYERGGRIAYFDAWRILTYLGIGQSTITFDEPYLDLPPVATGFGFYEIHPEMMFVPRRGCSA